MHAAVRQHRAMNDTVDFALPKRLFDRLLHGRAVVGMHHGDELLEGNVLDGAVDPENPVGLVRAADPVRLHVPLPAGEAGNALCVGKARLAFAQMPAHRFPLGDFTAQFPVQPFGSCLFLGQARDQPLVHQPEPESPAEVIALQTTGDQQEDHVEQAHRRHAIAGVAAGPEIAQRQRQQRRNQKCHEAGVIARQGHGAGRRHATDHERRHDLMVRRGCRQHHQPRGAPAATGPGRGEDVVTRPGRRFPVGRVHELEPVRQDSPDRKTGEHECQPGRHGSVVDHRALDERKHDRVDPVPEHGQAEPRIQQAHARVEHARIQVGVGLDRRRACSPGGVFGDGGYVGYVGLVVHSRDMFQPLGGASKYSAILK